jgi:hypothetical protein
LVSSEIATDPTLLEVHPVHVSLDGADALELGEILAFLSDWLLSDPNRLDASLYEFMGRPNFVGPVDSLGELRADLDRFAEMLLGYNPAEQR